MRERNALDELVALYLSECEPMLERVERLMLDADQNGALTDTRELFRLVHTLKGSSAMMGYGPLELAAHRLESVLAFVRDAGNPLSGDALQQFIDAGLAFTASFRAAFARIRAGEAPQSDEALLSALTQLADVLGVGPACAKEDGRAAPIEPHAPKAAGIGVLITLAPCPLPHMRAFLVAKAAGKLCASFSTDPPALDRAAAMSASIQRDGFTMDFVPLPGVSAEDVIGKLAAQPYVADCTRLARRTDAREVDAPKAAADEAKKANDEAKEAPTRGVTVTQSVVNQLLGFLDGVAAAESALETYIQETELQSRRLEELLSSLRLAVADAGMLASEIGMQDVGGVFLQMQRAVRGMARDLGKEIKVCVLGADVQVDKSLLEILSDSLIHLVRNAADHGIEQPDVRAAHGKPRAGFITLSARKSNDYLTVTVSDDGAGVDRRAVLARARRDGKLKKPDSAYSDADVAELLLSSGVSTSAGVTRYSGRGVGLDAVVRRVRQAGGRVLAESAEGRGTTFTLKIPITLMMIDGIEVRLQSGAEMIVPTNAVKHILPAGQFPDRISHAGASYTRLSFPGAPTQGEPGGYALLLMPDYGAYYLPAARVSMMSCYYVKPMPELVSDAMGRDYIYAGCVSRAGGRLLCVLDVDSLVGAVSSGAESERQRKL